MSLNITVPKIAITPEADDEDDNSFLNLAEALTDVEELFDDNVSPRPYIQKKKLKIKVTDNDGYNTALEDVEASDDDNDSFIMEHTDPFILDKLDMEQFSTEENFENALSSSRNSQCLNTKTSLHMENNILGLNDSFHRLQVLTDVEDYETDNEIEEDIIPNSTIVFDIEEGYQIVKISDDMQDTNQQRDFEEYQSEYTRTPRVSNEKNIVPPKRKPPTFSQMMKAKAKSTENKTRKRRRNKAVSRKHIELKEIEDTQSSETEIEEPKNRRKICSMNSLNYESDLEEGNILPFPVCKKTFTKKTDFFLKMPEFNNCNITDVEDIECDTDVTKRRVSVDCNLFQEQLDEMASCYSFTKDKHESIEKKNEIDDNAASKECLKPDRLLKSENTDQTTSRNKLSGSPIGDATTDVENIGDTSDSETEEMKEVNVTSDTEEKSFDDSGSSDSTDFPEVTLPPAARALVIAEETKSLIPTVRILPLGDEDIFDSEVETISTENEAFDSENDFQTASSIQSPLLPNFDGALVSVSENSLTPLHNKAFIEDATTDVEELDGVNSKKSPKKIKKSNKNLIPSEIRFSQLTDTEDIYESDDNFKSISKNLKICAKSDAEESKSSEDESNDNHASDLGLQKPQVVLAGHTDTEDLFASSDEDITYSRAETETVHEHKTELDQVASVEINNDNSSNIDDTAPEEVMYLKGGGYQESVTDVEELLDDIEVYDAVDAWYYFNHGSLDTTSVRGSGPATPQSTGVHDSSTSKDVSQASSSEKQEGQSRQQLDQHQLSEEMKELLKEMEKASKQ